MPLDRLIASSHAWMAARSPIVESLQVPGRDRELTAASLLHLSIEHNVAIHTLLDAGLAGSAIALYRPQFEAYVRGAWVQWSASEGEVHRFRRGKEPPGIDNLLQALEATSQFNDGALSSYKQKIWKSLCDYTHGGMLQIAARNTPSGIEHNFHVENLEGLLVSSVVLSFLAAQSLALICSDQAAVKGLQRAYEDAGANVA